MKPLVLVVEDNADLLFNIQLILEDNDYQVITAKNGKEALQNLSDINQIPEVIISDIMMPEMNGYDFFVGVSDNPLWNRIPFIFLTALDTPDDIRFGKMLGVDDYLTKPFKKEDLLAIIRGKISRSRKQESLNKKVEELLSALKMDFTPSLTEEDKRFVNLIEVFWDDIYGPDITKTYPEDENLPYSINDIGNQLFHAIVSITGHENLINTEGILLNIENIEKNGYLFYDSYSDETTRGGKKQYMLALIAPKISYYESLKIKEIFIEVSAFIKDKKSWDVKEYWEKCLNLLST